MEDQERYQLIDEFQKYLESGKDDATPQQMRRWLAAINQGAIPNEMVRHRAIINGLTINYLRLEQVTKSLDAQNSRTQRLVIVLAYIAIGVGILQIVVPLLLR